MTTGIGYLQFFDEPFVMTDGGPLDSTLSATMYAYNQFGNGNYDVASAAGYVVFVLIIALTVLQFRRAARQGLMPMTTSPPFGTPSRPRTGSCGAAVSGRSGAIPGCICRSPAACC